MKKGKINLVLGGAWGSEGKGKTAGYLALNHKVDGSVCDFMTNAGHWFKSKNTSTFSSSRFQWLQ